MNKSNEKSKKIKSNIQTPYSVFECSDVSNQSINQSFPSIQKTSSDLFGETTSNKFHSFDINSSPFFPSYLSSMPSYDNNSINTLSISESVDEHFARSIDQFKKRNNLIESNQSQANNFEQEFKQIKYKLKPESSFSMINPEIAIKPCSSNQVYCEPVKKQRSSIQFDLSSLSNQKDINFLHPPSHISSVTDQVSTTPSLQIVSEILPVDLSKQSVEKMETDQLDFKKISTNTTDDSSNISWFLRDRIISFLRNLIRFSEIDFRLDPESRMKYVKEFCLIFGLSNRKINFKYKPIYAASSELLVEFNTMAENYISKYIESSRQIDERGKINLIRDCNNLIKKFYELKIIEDTNQSNYQ